TREALFSLNAKTLVESGYGRLDKILDQSRPGPLPRNDGATITGQILIAPSWGKHALLELHGLEVVRPLLDSGFHVVLRPHPRTLRDTPDVINSIVRAYGKNPLFSLDTNGD